MNTNPLTIHQINSGDVRFPDDKPRNAIIELATNMTVSHLTQILVKLLLISRMRIITTVPCGMDLNASTNFPKASEYSENVPIEFRSKLCTGRLNQSVAAFRSHPTPTTMPIDPIEMLKSSSRSCIE